MTNHQKPSAKHEQYRLREGATLSQWAHGQLCRHFEVRQTLSALHTALADLVGVGFGNPKGIVPSSPRLLRRPSEQPGVNGVKKVTTATRLWPWLDARCRGGRNHVVVGQCGMTFSQGGSFVATLGFGAQSRWDSWSEPHSQTYCSSHAISWRRNNARNSS